MLKICSCSKLALSPATVCLVPELSKALAKAAQPPLGLGWFGSRGVSAVPGGTVHSWRGISRQRERDGRVRAAVLLRALPIHGTQLLAWHSRSGAVSSLHLCHSQSQFSHSSVLNYLLISFLSSSICSLRC